MVGFFVMGQDIAICDDIPIMCCPPLQPLPHEVQAVHKPFLHPAHPLQATAQDLGIVIAPYDAGHTEHIEHIFAGALLTALALNGAARRTSAPITDMSFVAGFIELAISMPLRARPLEAIAL